jgi:hypothetical protein
MNKFRKFAAPSLAAVLIITPVLYLGTAAGRTDLAPEPVRQVSIQSIVSQVVTVGQPFQFALKSNAGGFAHVYLLSASGKTKALAENLTLPPNGDRQIVFKLLATAPAGKDKVLVLATKNRIQGFSRLRNPGQPATLRLAHGQFRAALDRKIRSLPRKDWSFAETFVLVKS